MMKMPRNMREQRCFFFSHCVALQPKFSLQFTSKAGAPPLGELERSCVPARGKDRKGHHQEQARLERGCFAATFASSHYQTAVVEAFVFRRTVDKNVTTVEPICRLSIPSGAALQFLGWLVCVAPVWEPRGAHNSEVVQDQGWEPHLTQ
jgi:hypothetical protein